MPRSDPAPALTIDEVLAQVRLGLNLEAEAEQEVLAELRGHLEEAVEAARAAGHDEAAALRQAAERLGVEDAARELQTTHAGWGALNGIALAAVPVMLALALRWLVFAPDGTAVGWRQALSRPALWIIAATALLVPLLRLPRRRYVWALWAVFWGLSVATAIWPTHRW
ncbi:MAG: hypothetical protein ACUVX9_10450 [Anaerolineae bacterium]